MNTLDYALAPSVIPVKSGTAVSEQTLKLIGKLASKHQNASRSLKVTRKQFLAALLRFGKENLNNQVVVEKLLEERAVSFNQGSSYWRKVVLLWLDPVYDKSVATRYGQLLEYAHLSGEEPSTLYAKIEEFGFTAVASILKSEMQKKNLDQTMPRSMSFNALDDQVQAAGLSSGIQLDIQKAPIATGNVSVEGYIDDHGNFHIKGILPTRQDQQTKKLEKFEASLQPSPLDEKDVIDEILSLPKALQAGVSVEYGKRKGFALRVAHRGDEKDAFIYELTAPASLASSISWGFVDFNDFQNALKGVYSRSSKIIPKLDHDENGYSIDVNGEQTVLKSWTLKDAAIFKKIPKTSEIEMRKLWAVDLRKLIEADESGDDTFLLKALFGLNEKKIGFKFVHYKLTDAILYIAKRSSVVSISIHEDMITVVGDRGPQSRTLKVFSYKE